MTEPAPTEASKGWLEQARVALWCALNRVEEGRRQERAGLERMSYGLRRTHQFDALVESALSDARLAVYCLEWAQLACEPLATAVRS